MYKETKKETQINDTNKAMKNRIFDPVVKFDTQQLSQQALKKSVQAQPPASRHPPQQETRQMHSSKNKTPHRSTTRSSKMN